MEHFNSIVPLMMLVVSICTLPALGQHSMYRGDAPGSLAFRRLIAEPAIAQYHQPVQIVLADGGQIWYFDGGQVPQLLNPGMLLGMQVGPVYSLRVDTVLRGNSVSVFPTIEMLDRLYPPEGLASRHPVKIVLSGEEIQDAVAGSLVTKVIYLENPDTALPYRQTLSLQATLDIGLTQRPISIAGRLGRPLAILRIGSRHFLEPLDTQTNFPPLLLIEDLSPAPEHSPQAISDCCEVTACVPCQRLFSCSPVELENSTRFRRDEFLCDGSDRELQVVVTHDNQWPGLDLEDTVAMFANDDGGFGIVPSNRVCLYSPRFAAVRQVIRSNDSTVTQKLNVVNELTPVDTTRHADFSSTTLQQIQLQAHRKAERVNLFRDRTRGVLADNTVHLVGVRHQFKPFEDLQLVRFGKYSSSESARLSLGLQSAVAWDSDVSAQITVNNNQPVIVNDVYRIQELVTFDSEQSADLRLCKLASVIAAKPGEFVEFTIRFDNLGRQRLDRVTIVDNLSPRLEYVPGTAESSLEVEFSTENNPAGSQILKWDLTQPLERGTGGIIRFRCLVR